LENDRTAPCIIRIDFAVNMLVLEGTGNSTSNGKPFRDFDGESIL
jgi:hypothetical protein